MRRRFSQGAIQPIREILDELEARKKQQEEDEDKRKKKLRFQIVAKKVKNARIFVARDETKPSEDGDDDDDDTDVDGEKSGLDGA